MAATISKMLSFALDPTYHWAAMALLIFILAVFRRRGVVLLSFLLTCYLSLIFLSPIPQWMAEHLENEIPAITSPVPKPAVVVLSGGTLEFHSGFEQFYVYGGAERILVPLRNWAESESLFIVSGKDYDFENMAPFTSETSSMGKLALEQGVSEERLILESEARSTRENALMVAEILREKNIKDFYLVTSAFHMPRSLYAFRQEGLKPTPFPVDFRVTRRNSSNRYSMGMGNLGLFHLALHEYVGLAYYRLLDFFR